MPDHTCTLAFGDRTLTPGDTFEPFPDIPGYVVTFEGVHDGRASLADSTGAALIVALADIPTARKDTP